MYIANNFVNIQKDFIDQVEFFFPSPPYRGAGFLTLYFALLFEKLFSLNNQANQTFGAEKNAFIDLCSKDGMQSEFIQTLADDFPYFYNQLKQHISSRELQNLLLTFKEYYNVLQTDVFWSNFYSQWVTDPTHRKKNGQYFTDANLLETVMVDFDWKQIQFPLFDPTCGAGNLLVFGLKKILKNFSINDLMNWITGNINTEKKKHEYSALNSENLNKLPKFLLIGFDTELFLVEGSRLRLLDTLLSDLEKKNEQWHNGLKIWQCIQIRQVKDTLSEKELGKFGLILGNPPYINYNQSKSLEIDFLQSKNFCMADVFGINLHSTPFRAKKYSPKPNLFAFFLSQSLSLLNDNGHLFFIVPQTLLISHDLDVLRYVLARHWHIGSIALLSGQLFFDGERYARTSSLVIHISKKEEALNKNIKIFVKQESSERYFFISREQLLRFHENWSFLWFSETGLRYRHDLIQQSDSLRVYYNHKEAQKKGGENFIFDKGVAIDKQCLKTDEELTKHINKENSYHLPIFDKKNFFAYAGEKFIAADKVRYPQGSQGGIVWKKNYKILWRYMNPDRFYFSDDSVIVNFNYAVISSDSYEEMLYLFGLFNSDFMRSYLFALSNIVGEKDFLWGIRFIKKYMRIPRISPEDEGAIQEKNACIRLAEKILYKKESHWKELNHKVEQLYHMTKETEEYGWHYVWRG